MRLVLGLLVLAGLIALAFVRREGPNKSVVSTNDSGTISSGPNEGPSRRDPVGELIDHEVQIVDLIPKVKALFGERYGGNWASRTPGQEALVFGIRDPRPEDEVALKALRRHDSARYLRLAPVKYSTAQLEGFQEELRKIRSSLVPNPFLVTDMSFATNQARNQVTLTVDKDDPALDRFRAAIPADALRIVVNPTAQRARKMPGSSGT